MPPVADRLVDNTSTGLRRAWHVVATSAEVGPVPHRVWLLGEPWCVARTDDDRIGAWLDRCPHRLAPLSCGRLRGDQIECGYHGWRFGLDGRCVSVPSLGAADPPARAAVDVPARLRERYGLVWMAPEEPVAAPHRFPEWEDPSFTTGLSDSVRTRAGAALLVDNFLDAAHSPFVHGSTVGDHDPLEAAAPSGIPAGKLKRDDWSVEAEFKTWYRDQGRVRPQTVYKVANASMSVRLRVESPETGAVIAMLLCCTPERSGATRVYKVLARNDLAHDPALLAAFIRDENATLREDLSILERFDHEGVPLDRTVEAHTRADRLSLAWRSLVADLLARRRGGNGAARRWYGPNHQAEPANR